MPTLPMYEQQTTPSGELRGANLNPPQIYAPMGEQMQKAGAVIADIGMQMEHDTATAWAAQSAADVDLKVHQDYLSAQETTQPGAQGFATSYMDRIKKLEQETLKNAPNPIARQMITQHFASVREQYGKQAINFETQERERFVVDGFKNGADTKAKQLSEMPDAASIDAEAEKSVVLQNAQIDKLSLPPEIKAKLKDATREILLNAANKRKIDLDPSGYIKRTTPYKGGFDSAVDVILQEEGGYASNDGGSGAPVNFGINQAANPDVDVKTLTKDGAKKIYKERYWNAINGDSLPANMQLLAMDAAVNQGVGWTQKALKEANGDVNKFIQLRAERYQQIAKGDKAKYLDPWMNRLDRVAKRSTGASGVSTYDLGSYDQQQAWGNYAEQEQRRQQAVLQSTINTRYQDEMQMALDAKVPDMPISRDQLVAAYGEEEGNIKFANLEKTRELGQTMSDFKTMTDSEIALKIKEAEPKPGEGYAAADARYKVMQEAGANISKQRNDDPIAFAQKAGIAPMAALDGKDPQTIQAQMAARSGVAVAMHQKYGTPLNIFTKAEAEAIGNSLKTQGIDGKMGWLNMLRLTVHDPELYKAALQQIRPDSPVTAMAGIFLGMQGQTTTNDRWFGQDEVVSPQEVAQKLLKGEALLNPAKGTNKEDGVKSTYPMPSDKELQAEFNSYVGDSFRNMPQSYNEAYQAYRAFYAAETSEKGAPSSEPDTDAMEKSAKAVIGTVVDYNSNGNVIAPWGMSEADFGTAIQNKWNAFAKSQGYDEKQTAAFNGYGLMPSDTAGKYYVTSGNMIARDKDGKLVVLDITK